MTTSLTTFEETFRECLLAVLVGQWGELGSTLTGGRAAEDEVIDPEALVWCSLEFAASEPRVHEATRLWVRRHRADFLAQRLKKRLVAAEPRTRTWNDVRAEALSPRNESPHGKPQIETLDLDSRLGTPSRHPATLLVRARETLGGDVRHFLLASPHGASLRKVAAWSGYTYRSLANVAAQWRTQRIIRLERGDCRLLDPAPWRRIVGLGDSHPIVIDWFKAFDAAIAFLRFLAQARERNLSFASPVVTSHARDALHALELAAPFELEPPPSLASMTACLQRVISPLQSAAIR